MPSFKSIPGAGRFSEATLNKVYRRGLWRILFKR